MIFRVLATLDIIIRMYCRNESGFGVCSGINESSNLDAPRTSQRYCSGNFIVDTSFKVFLEVSVLLLRHLDFLGLTPKNELVKSAVLKIDAGES